MTDGATLAIALLSAVSIVIILRRGIVIIKPWEAAVYLSFGRYIRMLYTGISFIRPLFRDVIRIDMRPQSLDNGVPITYTQDGREIKCYITVNLSVSDPKKAFFEVTNYRTATLKIAGDETQRIISGMEYDAVVRSPNLIEWKIEQSMSRTRSDYGVKVNKVMLKIDGMEGGRCPQCNRASPIGFSHCGYCGTAISASQTQSARAEPDAIREKNHSRPHKIAESQVPDNLKPPYESDRGFPALGKKRRHQ
jgi:hypothetical protein